MAYKEPTPTVTGNNSSNLTILQTKTTNETALNTSPMATGSPAVQNTTGIPGTLKPNATNSVSEIPSEEQGIPWMWVLGGVVLICAIVPIAFFFHRKRQRDL